MYLSQFSFTRYTRWANTLTFVQLPAIRWLSATEQEETKILGAARNLLFYLVQRKRAR